MAGSWARARARERIGAVASEPLDASRLRVRVLAVLREVIDRVTVLSRALGTRLETQR